MSPKIDAGTIYIRAGILVAWRVGIGVPLVEVVLMFYFPRSNALERASLFLRYRRSVIGRIGRETSSFEMLYMGRRIKGCRRAELEKCGLRNWTCEAFELVFPTSSSGKQVFGQYIRSPGV